MKNQAEVVAALEKLGVSREQILVASPGELLELSGYGQQSAKVEILIKKSFHGGYGDVGFSKDSNGNYKVYVDDLDDAGSLSRKVGTKFSSGVNQWYAAVVAQKALKKQGLITKVEKDGNKIVVVAKG
tara:strand:+ start:6647 stop:7030 length:384 start_codon:yes stop_codon:yes gene_type:complete